ncbi:MAG: 6-carboxytetrahydropterin synthase QueD [Bacteroidales bacterium]|nr:6-carboxytetrahydropterin synthase QueD [Bacteroidales bacterium]
MFYLTKIFHFEAAHALNGYDGKCRNIHGHSYEMRVTVKGLPLNEPGNPKNGMVIDFHDLKTIVNQEVVDKLDHSFIIGNNMPNDFVEMTKKNFDKVVELPYQPTTENMLADFAQRIKRRLPQHVELYSVTLQETRDNIAEWREE